MPIENELKFALDDPAGALERALAGRPEVMRSAIAQAYLESPGVRIRRIEAAAGTAHVFTFKRTIESETVEIETALSPEDFTRLWSVRRETLHKTRFHVPAGECAWDVDFFKDSDGSTYFALAEVEMPPGRETAPAVPDWLAPHVIFEVERGDERFTSKRLADPEHARRLLAELLPALG